MDTKEKYRKLQNVMAEYSDFAYSSAKNVLSFIDLSKKSVVDFGCGRGDWLRAANDAGAREVLGLDTYALEEGALAIPTQAVDLTKPVFLGKRYDIALCLEVGEHLEKKYSETLIESLVRSAPVIVFSAAAPGQGGVGHVNEQPPAFWRSIFKSHNYLCYDFRAEIWDNPDIEPWYRMGTLMYCAPGAAEKNVEKYHVSAPLHLVHPQILGGYAPKGIDVIWLYDKPNDRWYPETLS